MRIDNDMGPFKPKPDDPALELVGNKTPITLKNIKYSSRYSKATHLFQATIYMDGKRAMKVSNDGKGELNQYYHTRGQSHHEFKRQFERAIKIAADYAEEKTPTSYLLDELVNDLMNEYFALKQMRNKMKTKTIFYDKKLKKVFHHDHKPTPENLSYLKRNLYAKSGVLFFNDIPEAEAFYYWRKI